MRAWIKYLVTFAVVTIVGSMAILLFEVRITGCSGYGYGSDVYLGQCASKAYGDYEHGVFGLQIDKRAIDSLERAELVILGHSHAMVGFSTLPTRQFFDGRRIRFYNASVSGEYGPFFDFVLSRLHLNAKVMVIDVAPFFAGDLMSAAGKFIVENPNRAMIEYRLKQLWQTIHKYSCLARRPIEGWLCGTVFSTFRSAIDGGLIADYTLVYGSPLSSRPVTRTAHPPAENELRIKLAEQFFARHRLNPGCTILTAVPTGDDFSDSAKAIADALHANYINPSIDGLTLIDAAHLDVRSATAWSRQFWIESEPIIERCLERARH